MKENCTAVLEVSFPRLWTVAQLLAFTVSFVPWIVGTVIVVASIVRPTLRGLLVPTAIVAIASEVILKPWIQSPRPAESCLTSRGMPSTHCAFAIAWAGFYWKSMPISSWERIGLALLLAVPWARVELGDHSIAQAAAGCVLGGVVALFTRTILVNYLAALATRRAFHTRQQKKY